MRLGSITGREKVIRRGRWGGSAALDFRAETTETRQLVGQERQISSGTEGQQGKKGQDGIQDRIRGFRGNVKSHFRFW